MTSMSASVIDSRRSAGRHANPGFTPKPVGLFVVPIKRFESRLQLYGEAEGIQALGLAAALLGHFGPDMFPEIAEDWHVAAGYVVGDWHTRGSFTIPHSMASISEKSLMVQ